MEISFYGCRYEEVVLRSIKLDVVFIGYVVVNKRFLFIIFMIYCCCFKLKK